ncbi:DUF4160 domain-containing protein [Treponema sp. TIM-1]|uniref:DUF4160 domain-containing protein n=1 Tax=Treponema sp. TIM-1 TaxID=2898417 RepID=UPI00397F5BCB
MRSVASPSTGVSRETSQYAIVPKNIRKKLLENDLAIDYYKIMPELSRFLGIIMAMYFNDHNPPHFHVIYNEYDAEIDIRNLSILEGKLPARILGLAIEWAELHKDELVEDWDLIQTTGKYNKIQPLV